MTGTSMLEGAWQNASLASIARLAPVQMLSWPAVERFGIQLAIKREDLLDPRLGGNKFYKLYEHLQQREPTQPVLSFGGAYSNHLYALAAAGRACGFATIGVVRGEPSAQLGPTLQDVMRLGMRLTFVSRADYRRKSDPDFLAYLREVHGPFHHVAEGGADLWGARGCKVWAEESVNMCPFQPTHLCVAAGTGATLAGLLAARQTPKVLGVLALKGPAEQTRAFERQLVGWARALLPADAELPKLQLSTAHHCGGYARYPTYLRAFVEAFERETGVPLDPVYTAKLLWAVVELANTGAIEPGSRLLLMHTGGLQGKRGYEALAGRPP